MKFHMESSSVCREMTNNFRGLLAEHCIRSLSSFFSRQCALSSRHEAGMKLMIPRARDLQVIYIAISSLTRGAIFVCFKILGFVCSYSVSIPSLSNPPKSLCLAFFPPRQCSVASRFFLLFLTCFVLLRVASVIYSV